jgi:hypothetical protein
VDRRAISLWECARHRFQRMPNRFDESRNGGRIINTWNDLRRVRIAAAGFDETAESTNKGPFMIGELMTGPLWVAECPPGLSQCPLFLLTTMPVSVPVMLTVSVSVAVSDSVPTVLSVALKV